MLTSLRLAKFASNALTELPACITALQSLAEVSFASNKVSIFLPFPFFFSFPFHLTHSFAYFPQHDQLRTLTPEFGRLSNLVKLELHANRLMKLPSSFRFLVQLKDLSLQHNRLRTLPEEIGELRSLQNLNLAGNKVRVCSKPLNSQNTTSMNQFSLPYNGAANFTAHIICAPVDSMHTGSLV